MLSLNEIIRNACESVLRMIVFFVIGEDSTRVSVYSSPSRRLLESIQAPIGPPFFPSFENLMLVSLLTMISEWRLMALLIGSIR